MELFVLFLIFIYFKLARVHKKEEHVQTQHYIAHAIVAISTVSLYNELFHHLSVLSIALVSFSFFIIAALMITTVQLGVFIDGKPIIGISKLYKAMLPLAFIIGVLSLVF